MPRAVETIEIEIEWRLPGAGGGGMQGYCLVHTERQFWKDEKPLDPDGDGGCTAM